MEIKLLHLFYDLMNLYGEYGNINILKSHLEDQGATVIVDKKSIDDEVNFSEYDFIYCGSGTEKNQKLMIDYLQKNKENFKKYIDSGKIALFTGNSFEVVGKSVLRVDGTLEELLGFADFEVINTKDRITGDTILHSRLLEDKMVGFVNKQSYLEKLNTPLFDVEFGVGADKENKYDGIRINNFFGTYLIGPVLVKNPKFLCFFVKEIIKSKEENYSFKDIKYEDEENCFKIVLDELMNRKNEK